MRNNRYAIESSGMPVAGEYNTFTNIIHTVKDTAEEFEMVVFSEEDGDTREEAEKLCWELNWEEDVENEKALRMWLWKH